jgi:hypothetical protein
MFKFSSLFSLLLFALIPFLGIAQDCSIDNIIVEQHDCNDDGFFYVDIVVEASNSGEEGYSVHGNGTDYGNFSYNETFITLGPLAGDGTTPYEFVVTDNVFPNCSNFVEFGIVDCTPAECNLSELALDFQNCNDDGSYNFILNFDYANTNNVGFDLFINGDFYEFYSYADLPVAINHVGPFNTDFFGLQVCENDNSNCCIGNEFMTPDCQVSDDCLIDNVIVEAHPCNDDGYFLVDIEVQAVNHGTQGFSVHGNGTDYGDFSYDETFITIGPLQGDGTTVWEFIITDLEFPDCTNNSGLEPIDCSTNECGFEGLTFNFEGCNDLGGYNYTLDFEPVNTTNEFFDFYVGNELFETYAYAELPVFIYGIGPFNDNTFQIKICDNDNPNCCLVETFETPDCGGNNDCVIEDIIIELYDCNADGLFLIDLVVVAPNHGNEGYSVLGNGNDYGDFSYEEPYITLGPFEGNGTSVYEFVVIDNQFPDCVNEAVIEAPVCFPDDCGFAEIQMNFEGCNDDGSFNYNLNFDPQGTTNELFDLWVNNEYYGFSHYSELPLYIEGIGPYNEDAFVITICDNDNPDCCVTYSVETPDCGGNDDCVINHVIVEAYECNDDGYFYVDLVVFGNNLGTQGFSVVGNGNDYGDFSYNEPHITLGPFAGDGTTVYEFVVIDNQYPDCSDYAILEPIDCNPGDCGFEGITFNFEGCNDDGAYNYVLNFDPVNNINPYFNFYVNDELIGYFPYEELPLFIEGIGPFNNEIFTITICDNDNPDCCVTHTIETPSCGGNDDCVINHVIVEAYDCNDDGYFYVDLVVFGNNLGTQGFSVVGNGNDYGDFSYNEPFITLGPFIGDGSSVYEFVVIDNQYPDCSDHAIIEPIDCNPGDCGFNDFSFNFEGCNDDGSYNFALNFAPVNTSNNYFDFFVNNEFYGYFEYEDLAVFIEGIGPFNTDYFVIQICDNDNPDCCQVYEVMTPECNNNGDCNIWDVEVEPHIADCDNEIFSVDVAFESTNTGSLGYYIFANGDIFGPFSYSLPFATIGPFDGDGETQYDFLILDVANPACYAYHEFGTFECDDDVWPGDTNSDNIASHFDLLNIGIAFGFEGPERDDDNTEWDAMPALNWNHFFEDNTNYKHADSDGNGYVDENDITAIYQNYNFTHGDVETFDPPTGTEIDPPVYLDVPDNINTGTAFQIPIMLGTEGESVSDIYGIAFSIELDPELINISDLSVEFPTSWFGEPGINVITLDRLDPETNTLDIAISRTDHNNVSGYGPIVILHGIIDDIAGIHEEVNLRATYINAIDFAQNPIPLNNPFKTSVISKVKDTEAGFVSLMRDTWVVPNPASDVINIMNKKYVQVEAMAIYNMSGVQIGETFLNTNEISIAHLPAGLYTLRLNMSGHVINKKLVKVQK